MLKGQECPISDMNEVKNFLQYTFYYRVIFTQYLGYLEFGVNRSVPSDIEKFYIFNTTVNNFFKKT